MFNNLTSVQKITLAIAALGFLSGAGTQLTDIFSPLGSMAPVVVKEIISISGFVSGFLSVVLYFASGQVAQLKAVQAMPGVESILLNSKANQTAAILALDPKQDKIEAIPAAKAAVEATAKAA
jgi:hypothetical protein